MPTTPPLSAARRLRPVLVGALVTLAAIIVVLVGRSLLTSHFEESHSYPDAAAIPAANGLFVLPDWAPADATDITIHVQTQGKGRSLELTSGATGTPDGCQPTPRPAAEPVPSLTDVGQGDGVRCGEWFVVRDGSRVSAWTAYSSAS